MADQTVITIEDRVREEEIVVEETVPDGTEPKPNLIVTTKRVGGIKRGMPLTESHGMITEANRFRET